MRVRLEILKKKNKKGNFPNFLKLIFNFSYQKEFQIWLSKRARKKKKKVQTSLDMYKWEFGYFGDQ